MRNHAAKYIAHIHAKPAHHRRRFSMQIAAVITVAVFLVWLSTLGIRLATSGGETTFSSSQSAAALTAVPPPATQAGIPEGSGSLYAN